MCFFKGGLGNSNYLGGTLKFRGDTESKIQGGFLYIGGIQSFRGDPKPLCTLCMAGNWLGGTPKYFRYPQI